MLLKAGMKEEIRKVLHFGVEVVINSGGDWVGVGGWGGIEALKVFFSFFFVCSCFPTRAFLKAQSLYTIFSNVFKSTGVVIAVKWFCSLLYGL